MSLRVLVETGFLLTINPRNKHASITTLNDLTYYDLDNVVKSVIGAEINTKTKWHYQ